MESSKVEESKKSQPRAKRSRRTRTNTQDAEALDKGERQNQRKGKKPRKTSANSPCAQYESSSAIKTAQPPLDVKQEAVPKDFTELVGEIEKKAALQCDLVVASAGDSLMVFTAEEFKRFPERLGIEALQLIEWNAEHAAISMPSLWPPLFHNENQHVEEVPRNPNPNTSLTVEPNNNGFMSLLNDNVGMDCESLTLPGIGIPSNESEREMCETSQRSFSFMRMPMAANNSNNIFCPRCGFLMG